MEVPDGTRPDARVSAAFIELAQMLVNDYDVVELGQHLVETSVRLLDAAAVGLLLGDQRGHLQVLAASSEEIRLVELFQVHCNEGPCLEAYRTGEQVHVADLRVHDDEWPAFAEKAVGEGFHSVFALPLRLRKERVGALNLFRTNAGTISETDLAIGQGLADVATLGILHQRTETVNVQLQSALNSRVIIEQAKGIIAERGGVGVDDAFTKLRAHSRNTNQRLVEVARKIVAGTIDTATFFGR
ncbi:GAF and ANTAR domain-containing protein [Antrihabitans sp. YC2-6]|uniref:GAF and ANTAR domain-containing protein n=1 Tax=Antrihabitans sp. YC2-6 TaxID=2799498 RepID=UPI0018F562F9|nr:GAF and ANTAR domain-containing protein [Antrihabitans sp. YC2-6]MBJ8345527.1 GAF and ANTAR domain-containing protein [Antrihabitans sp. YC2-6]